MVWNKPARFWVELITAESEESRLVRHRRLIRFPRVTMPLLAAWTPPHWHVTHTDGIVRRFHAHGMAVQAGIIFGFEGDDRSVFRETVDFFREIARDSATVSLLVPFPGTPLFRRLEAGGRILTRDWSKYNGKKDVVFEPARMSPAELLLGTEWAARRFYALGAIAARMWRSRTGLWWNIPRNLGYHLALRNFGNIGSDPAAVQGSRGLCAAFDL